MRWAWKRSSQDRQRIIADRRSHAEAPTGEAQVLDHVEAGVVLVGPDRQVRWLNESARRLFTTPERAIGRPVLEIVRDHRLDGLVAKALESGVTQATEVELTGSGRTVRARAARLADLGGAALVIEDLTRLRYLETVRQQFVANLSHELRTPLAGLDLAAQTLAGQLPTDTEVRTFMDRILQETQRIAAILQNLTQLAALDAEEIPVERERFSIADLLNENVARYAARAKSAGVGLRAEFPDGGLEALGDRAKTDQALQSIVDNALKFTASGEVVLGAGIAGNMVEIRVRDTGVGIPATDLPRIFERFYKVDRSRHVAGSGLGLSIARHLIELQGGTISAESTPGAGTVILFRLPPA